MKKTFKMLPYFILGSCLSAAANAQNGVSSVDSNFNGTAIPAGDTIWFNSVVNLTNNKSSTVHLYLRNASVTFNSTTFALPDSDITFLPTGSVGTISYSANKWTESVSTSLSGSEFLTGGAYLVPGGGIAGGANPISWTGQFLSDVAGATFSWKWAAAVYTQFNSNLSLIDVKPVDDTHVAPWSNSDHAGTPENEKSFVTGGGRGGGGSNYTGSYSGTTSVTAGPVPEPTTLVGLGILGLAMVSRRKK
jgi:hypothetical protein